MDESQTCKTRHFSQERWFRVHNVLVDCFVRILGADGIVIYNVLCRHARNEKIRGMTVKRIAEAAGIGRTKTFRVLTLLEENLLVRRQKVPGQTSCYLLLDVYHAISVCRGSSSSRRNANSSSLFVREEAADCRSGPSASAEGGTSETNIAVAIQGPTDKQPTTNQPKETEVPSSPALNCLAAKDVRGLE